MKKVSKHPLIDRLKPSTMKFDLSRVVRVMENLDNPQDSYPSVHVAGTNGKGSVTAMIAQVLRETGLTVGMYTSPHLEIVNERFQVNGRMISDRDLRRFTSFLIRTYSHLTQFEFLTVIAFLWFAEKKVDVAVVETGLGGRLDATNILRRVLVSIITNIDFDHTEWLGNTVEKIAREKAGIIKPSVPVVTGAQGVALRVIKSVAKKRNAPVIIVKSGIKGPRSSLEGRHQQHNAAVAKAVLRLLNGRYFSISEKQMNAGFAHVHWPGRFEEIKPGIILDGAHNPAGCRVLVRALHDKKKTPVNLLFGALKDKDVGAMAKILSSVTAQCVTTPVPSERSATPAALANLPAWKSKTQAASSIGQGWKKVQAFRPKRPVVVAGSLYLVGEMRRRLR